MSAKFLNARDVVERGGGVDDDRMSVHSAAPSITSQLHTYVHREASVFGVTLNTLCNVMGAGVLSLPFAMYNGSIVISLILLLITGFFSAAAVFILTYACEVSGKFSYTECLSHTLFPDQPLSSQMVDDDLDEGVFDQNESVPRRRRRWVTMGMELVIFLNMIAVQVIYAVVISSSIPPVLAAFFGASGVWTTSWLWLVAPAVIFFVLSCARSMNELKWTSIVGFVTILYVVVMVIVRYFTITGGKDVSDVRVAEVKVSVFDSVSAFSAAFGFHVNVPYFYRELKDRRPAVMMETVKNAFPIITVCYIAAGLLGYLTFGSEVGSQKAGGNIMNSYSKHDIAINIGRLGLFFHFVSVYPILSVCARRGLHRFICLAFAAPQNLDGEVLTHDDDDDDQANENPNAPLKVNASAPSSSAAVHHPEIVLPGDPSTTTIRSIILEAFFIVTFSTVVAAFVPGMGIVVEFTGIFFAIPQILILPGLIGRRIFQENIRATEHLPLRLLRNISTACVIIGVVFLACGLVSFIFGFVN